MYHSYSMQVHGYIVSPTSSGRCSFTLVHGVSHLLYYMDSYAATSKHDHEKSHLELHGLEKSLIELSNTFVLRAIADSLS